LVIGRSDRWRERRNKRDQSKDFVALCDDVVNGVEESLLPIIDELKQTGPELAYYSTFDQWYKTSIENDMLVKALVNSV
jgi:3-methyladenine DNA glycosylase AlkC